MLHLEVFEDSLPCGHKELPVVVVEESDVAEEGTRQENIPKHGGELLLEVFAAVFPPILLGLQVY